MLFQILFPNSALFSQCKCITHILNSNIKLTRKPSLMRSITDAECHIGGTERYLVSPRQADCFRSSPSKDEIKCVFKNLFVDHGDIFNNCIRIVVDSQVMHNRMYKSFPIQSSISKDSDKAVEPFHVGSQNAPSIGQYIRKRYYTHF